MRPIHGCRIVVHEFNTSQKAQETKTLAFRILKSLALGLGLDQDFFVLCHQEILGPKSISKLRSIYYPALSKIDLVSGHVRCGEHSDYGTITFLYQVWTIISAVHSLEKIEVCV